MIIRTQLPIHARAWRLVRNVFRLLKLWNVSRTIKWAEEDRDALMGDPFVAPRWFAQRERDLQALRVRQALLRVPL